MIILPNAFSKVNGSNCPQAFTLLQLNHREGSGRAGDGRTGGAERRDNPQRMATSKTLPRMEAWSLELVGRIVEAKRRKGLLRIACAMPRNDILVQILIALFPSAVA